MEQHRLKPGRTQRLAGSDGIVHSVADPDDRCPGLLGCADARDRFRGRGQPRTRVIAAAAWGKLPKPRARKTPKVTP